MKMCIWSSEDIGGYPDLYVATGKERREGEKWTRLSKSQLE